MLVNRLLHIAGEIGCTLAGLWLLARPPAVWASPTEHNKPAAGAPRLESPAPLGHAGIAGPASVAEACRQAAADRKPVLVRVGASFCPACRRLDAEMQKPAVREELQRWIVLDLDQLAEDAAPLGVEGVPALRVLSVRGRQVAAHDGYLPAAELIQWLKQSYEAASPALDAVLSDTGKPDIVAVVRLVRLLAGRDPVFREAAIRRLVTAPDVAAPAVVKTLREGKLGARLSALEVLSQWHAPIDGLDPWRPETLSAARLAALQQWVDAGARPPRPAQLTAADRAAAGQAIQQMLQAPAGEVEALRERLAHFGPPLLPEVQRRLQTAATDEQRQRLRALRYRLLARDSLVLAWPGGLDRLSATDSKLRRKAAEELAAKTDAQDRALLMELFSDADPLVREMGLRGLQNMGGSEAVAALTRLLDDPLPNVRAAVLKQLAEDPLPEMVPAVGEYLKREKDADLAVHAARFFEAAGGKEAVKNLLTLLHHPSWQVRAEAAEAVGKAVESGRQRIPQELKVDAYVAALDLLNDEDAFVVSRVVAGLGRADMELAVEPLAKAAAKHPELTEAIVKIFSNSDKMFAKSLPHLQRFCKDARPEVRAAAFRGLGKWTSDELYDQYRTGLLDADRGVRIAAAAAVFESQETQQRAYQARFKQRLLHDGSDEVSPVLAAPDVLGSLWRAFSGGARPTPVPPQAASPKPSAVPPAPSKEAKPAAAPAADAVEEPLWDQGLRKWFARKRPPELERLPPPLEKMLQAADGEERLAGASALVALNRSAIALPVVRRDLKVQHEQLDQAAQLLPWLLWSERLALFNQLWPLAGSDHEAEALIRAMSQTQDVRAADRFWALLADRRLTPEIAESLRSGLEEMYMPGSDGEDSQARQRRELAAAARPRVTSGPELQRLVALALLANADAAAAAEAAGKLMADTRQSPALRDDAFEVLLAAEPTAEATPAAVAALSGDNARRRATALDYLVNTGQRYLVLREAISVSVAAGEDVFGNRERGVPPPPPGLKPQQLKPLLQNADPKVAAYAGYLLALLGDPQGLDTLIAFWREHEGRGESATAMVYRAIAALDDSRQLPLLEKIYQKLQEYEVADFYWTIRSMTGPEIVQLRQRIRKQVGMDRLR